MPSLPRQTHLLSLPALPSVRLHMRLMVLSERGDVPSSNAPDRPMYEHCAPIPRHNRDLLAGHGTIAFHQQHHTAMKKALLKS